MYSVTHLKVRRVAAFHAVAVSRYFAVTGEGISL